MNSKMKYCAIDKVSSNLNKDFLFVYLRWKKKTKTKFLHLTKSKLLNLSDFLKNTRHSVLSYITFYLYAIIPWRLKQTRSRKKYDRLHKDTIWKKIVLDKNEKQYGFHVKGKLPYAKSKHRCIFFLRCQGFLLHVVQIPVNLPTRENIPRFCSHQRFHPGERTAV